MANVLALYSSQLESDKAAGASDIPIQMQSEWRSRMHIGTTVCSEYIWRLVFREFENDGKVRMISYFGNLLGNFGGISCKKNFENISIIAKVKFSVH